MVEARVEIKPGIYDQLGEFILIGKDASGHFVTRSNGSTMFLRYAFERLGQMLTEQIRRESAELMELLERSDTP